MLNKINIFIGNHFLSKSFFLYVITIFIALQLIIAVNFNPYAELQTIISWHYGQMGLFESMGMRIGEDGTIKGSYSFIYLLPTYIIFTILKYIISSDLLALTIANILIINTQFLLLVLVAKKLFLNPKITSLIFIAFFLTTYMWTGIVRVFPHDILIILALLQILFPNIRLLLMVLMVYVDPVVGSLFVFMFFIIPSLLSGTLLLSFFKNLYKIIFVILIGAFLWIFPIWYLENILGYDILRGSIWFRVFGNGDEYFFSRLQIFTPFHYYLPNAISVIFPSIYFALALGASNLISPISSYILYASREELKNIAPCQNLLFVHGICFIVAYIIFAFIFGQAAASHRFDYDQYFQIGLIFCLSSLISLNMGIANTLSFKLLLFYSFYIITPIILITLVV